MNRTTIKAVRDLAVIAAGAAVLAVAESVGDLGLPHEVSVIVSTVALALYRVLRNVKESRSEQCCCNE
jgi:hypothetical protein